MPATLVIGGKVHEASPKPQPKLKPAIALERITIALSTIHDLLIDVEMFQSECRALERRIRGREKKLNDPELQDHPGWRKAQWEWAQWHAEQWWAAENARTAGVLLRSQCIAIACCWQDLTEVEQEQVMTTVRHAAPGDGAVLRRMERVRRLSVWNGLLWEWGTAYEMVPF